jgi:hypothetical protein
MSGLVRDRVFEGVSGRQAVCVRHVWPMRQPTWLPSDRPSRPPNTHTLGPSSTLWSRIASGRFCCLFRQLSTSFPLPRGDEGLDGVARPSVGMAVREVSAEEAAPWAFLAFRFACEQ